MTETPDVWCLAVHGGAGRIEQPFAGWEAGIAQALDVGGAVLAEGGTALDAVTAAVVSLEENPDYNAGRGSVLTSAGTVEMDAAVMDHRRDGGAVTLVRTTRNPIRLARAVMEQTPHVLLVGDALALELGLEQRPNDWFITERRAAALARARGLELDHGTVGAVAVDVHGHCAAATSTGGMTNKRPGRVGDTPILGAGTWADATCAVSCTGHGELILRTALARRVARFREDNALERAAERALSELSEIDGAAGLIAVDVRGVVTLPYTTLGMYRGWRHSDGRGDIGA